LELIKCFHLCEKLLALHVVQCFEVLVAVAAFVIVSAVGALYYRAVFVVFGHIWTSGGHVDFIGGKDFKIVNHPRWLTKRCSFQLAHTGGSF
jgi:hypothetical protein